MRSLESSRHTDLDMVDAEHLSHEKREFSWDDLKDVPFAGNKTSIDWDSLPDVQNDVNSGQKEEILKKMDEVSSFGRGARTSVEKSDAKMTIILNLIAWIFRISATLFKRYV